MFSQRYVIAFMFDCKYLHTFYIYEFSVYFQGGKDINIFPLLDPSEHVFILRYIKVGGIRLQPVGLRRTRRQVRPYMWI